MSASIKLNFFYSVKNVDRYQFPFQSKVQDITKDQDEVNIPDSVFKFRKDKVPMSIKLFETKLGLNKEFHFHIYYGKNSAYVQLDELLYNSFEIIFRNIENLHILGINTEFTELDTIGNNDKKRLVLINYTSFHLSINEIKIDLSQIIQKHCSDFSTSYQFSEIDFRENKFIVKPMKKIEEHNFDFLLEKKDRYKEFVEELNNVVESEESIYIKKIGEIANDYKDLLSYKFIFSNKTQEYLEKTFAKVKIFPLEIFYNYFLLVFFYEQQDFFAINRTVAVNYIYRIKNITDDIQENPDISMIEKIRAVNALFLTNSKLDNLKDLNNLNIKYYFYTNNFENSILDKVIKFIDTFIKTLNEKSVVYQNLSFLDGGYGYYNKEKVYAYDLINLEMLKSHLREIIPQIFIFFYMDDSSASFTAPEFYGIVFNEKYVLQNYENINGISLNSYDKPVNTQNKIIKEMHDDIAMNIVIYLFHEMMGHKKNSLAEPGTESPKKVINKENKLIELKYYKEKEQKSNKDDNSEYILTSNNNRGDSGHFLELSYGKIGYDLLMKLLCRMKNKGKLIERADLFTDDGEKLKKFVTLKKFIEDNKIEYDFINNLSIEDEIIKMETLVNNYKPIENEIKGIEDIKEDKNEFLNKKRNAEQNLEDQEKPGNKKPKLNLMNSNENIDPKKESGKDKDNDENLSFYERIKGKSHEEVVEMSRKRVLKRFNFKYDENLRYNLIKKAMELESDDPCFNDIFIVIGDLRKII